MEYYAIIMNDDGNMYLLAWKYATNRSFFPFFKFFILFVSLYVYKVFEKIKYLSLNSQNYIKIYS